MPPLPEKAEKHGGRIAAGVFAVMAAIVIVSALLTFVFGNRVLRAHAQEGSRRELISELDLLLSTIKDAETGQRGFLITGEDQYLQPYQEAVDRLPKNLERLTKLEIGTGSSDQIAAISQLINEKLSELQATVDLRRTSGFDAAIAMVREGKGQRTMEQLRVAVNNLRSQQIGLLRSDAQFSDLTTRTRTWVFILTSIVSVLFLIWAFQRINEALKARDVALRETRRRGQELERQTELLSVTLASIGDCVIVTDEQGRITFMNQVAEEVTGWTLAEARAHPTADVFRIVNEQTRESLENPVEKVIRQGVIVGLANHTILIRKDGSEIPIDDSGAPIRSRDGILRGVVLVFRDFSDYRTNERELRKAKEEAETANKAKDQFLAMLSHELRTPLTPVLATLNLWEASEDVPASMHSDVQVLRRSIELEARIIDDLLDLTRIARGMLSFSPENTDVHGLIEFLIGLSRSEFQEKELKVTTKLDAPEHTVHTDVARLQQILWNILRNAIKFTDSSGRITVTTMNDAEGNISIVVEDTGIGMTSETLSRLFVPFEQADRSRKSRYGGLGLGMAISNALVELLEGKLTAKSEGLGRGSTLTVTFPTVKASAAAEQPEKARQPSHGKVKLLLLEDHADTARALSRLLESRGYEVATASTVAAARETVGSGKFDLLLCDLGLPDGTGFDFIEKFRQESDTPAIALTGFGMQQDVERAQQAGFDAHLTKPVNLQKLEVTIWKLLQDR